MVPWVKSFSPQLASYPNSSTAGNEYRGQIVCRTRQCVPNRLVIRWSRVRVLFGLLCRTSMNRCSKPSSVNTTTLRRGPRCVRWYAACASSVAALLRNPAHMCAVIVERPGNGRGGISEHEGKTS
jgi:hypothetical protein